MENQKRVYFLVSALIDDNEDVVEGSYTPLCGTTSQKVARQACEVFEKYRNGRLTMIHQVNVDKLLPSETPTVNHIVEEEEDSEEIKNLLSKVQF